MTFKIESRQKRVAGVGGHNHLALVNEKGIVQGEIHGHRGDNNRLIFERGILEPEVEGLCWLEVRCGYPARATV